MPLRPRPLDRSSGVLRDATLVVIASEDTHAVKNYFDRFKAPRVSVIVIPSQDGKCSPDWVLRNLDNFKATKDFEDDDKFWLCIDRDKWPVALLSNLISECKKKGYEIAMSHPCFELWTYLHFSDLAQSFANCNELSSSMKDLLGGYTKRCCNASKIDESMVHRAVARAKMTDVADLIPNVNCTRVYKILEHLLSRDQIHFT